VITVDRLTKEFGRTRAVREVSFHVRGGEIVGLLGPNGSGKTTILRMLAGFFPPTAGRAAVAGFDVAAEPERAKMHTGYLPEHVLFYPEMRVDEFLTFCADVRGLRGARRRARLATVLHDCGLDEVRRRQIGRLSKGYRQRLGLAQALLHEPAALILDEPTVGLDPRQIVEIRSLIGALRGRTTVLLSTHILPEVAATCQRVVIVDRGQVVAEDSAEGLRRRLQAGERTFVRVEGPPEAVLAALRAVAGVDRVDENGTADGRSGYVCHSHAGEPVRQAIAAAIVGHGWGLAEVRPLALTLEDLFVRLVTDETPPAP